MTWVRIDDKMPENPKVLGVPLGARWLHVCGIAYCSRHETDGFVPLDAVPVMMAGLSSASASKRFAGSLVKAGLWHGRPGGYEINDYLEWNSSKEEIRQKRRARNARVTRYRANHGNAPTDTDAYTDTEKHRTDVGIVSNVAPDRGDEPREQKHEQTLAAMSRIGEMTA